MAELKKLQSFTFDSIARRRFLEDQDTILELLMARYQNCKMKLIAWMMKRIVLNDSKDFQDAESIRSGNSHVTSRPVSFPPHPIPEGMQSRSVGMPSRRERAAKHLGHTWYLRETFLQIQMPHFQHLIRRNWIHGIPVQKSRFTSSTVEKSETNTSSRSEMPLWTVSQKFCHLQWRRLFNESWGRPTTIGVFRSSFWHAPYTSHVCLLEEKDSRPRYVLVHNILRKQYNGSKTWSWLIQWTNWYRRHPHYVVFQCRIFEVVDARIASALNRIIHDSHFKRRISLEEQEPRSRTVSFAEDRFAYRAYFRVTGANDSVENYADPCSQLFFEMMMIRERPGRLVVTDKNQRSRGMTNVFNRTSKWSQREGVPQWDMFPGLRRVAASLVVRSNQFGFQDPNRSTVTPKTNLLTSWPKGRISHTMSGIICCPGLNISHFSSTVCSETMAKRIRKHSGEERVTAKSRTMTSLIARAPLHVSSSTSVSPGKRSYGNQNPWSTIAEKEEDRGDPISATTERPHSTTIIMSNLWKVFPQQATPKWDDDMLGLLKSGKLILRCANDRGDPM